MKRKTSVIAKQGEHKGQLKIFFSYTSKTGATSDMLGEAAELSSRGYEVIVSVLRSPETGAPQGVPFDLGYFLAQHPDFVVIDDIAFDNAGGSVNKHRWQDVEELLKAGIDVYATMHVGNIESERDRITQITGIEPKFTIPEKIFFSCDQLEFVDIDPKELQERSAQNGSGNPLDLVALKELRALALHWVSEYALQSSKKDTKHHSLRSLDVKVLALLHMDGADELVIHEASRMAEALHAPLQVLYVDRAASGAKKANKLEQKKQESFAALRELCESLQANFVVLNGEDAPQVAADYIQMHGVSDVVMSREPLNMLRRLVLPFMLPRVDKMASLLPAVHIHSVPRILGGKRHKLANPVLKSSAFNLSVHDVWVTLVAVVFATLCIKMLSNIGFSNQTSVLVYVLSAAVVARVTKGYLPGILCSLLSTVAMSYFFVRPYFSFEVEHKANYVTFVIMLVVSLIITTLASRMQRDSMRARYREQHTQVLYELNKTLLLTRGMSDVASVSLETVSRLFDKASVLYLGNPYDEVVVKTRPAKSDVNTSLFSEVLEKEAAFRCFSQQVETGMGTDVLSTASAFYLPVHTGDTTRAVLGVSFRTGEISVDNKNFLLMMVNQIALALERQALLDEHRHDLRVAKLDSVRTRYAEEISQHLDQSSIVLNEYARKLLACPEEEGKKKEQLIALISSESTREHYLSAGLNRVLTGKKSDKLKGNQALVALNYLVKAAVDKARENCPEIKMALELRDTETKLIVDTKMFVDALSLLVSYMAKHQSSPEGIAVNLRSHTKGSLITLCNDQDEEAVELINLVTSPSYAAKREQQLSQASLSELAELGDTDDKPALISASAALRAHGGSIRARRRIGGGVVLSIQIPY